MLWLRGDLVPEGWSGAAVLSAGMVAGLLLHRMVQWLAGWLVEPARRHLGAHWEAKLRLLKLDDYRERGLLGTEEAAALASKIAEDDISSKLRRK